MTDYNRIMVGVDALEGDSYSPLLEAYETARHFHSLLVIVFVYDEIGYAYLERTDPKGATQLKNEAETRMDFYRKQAFLHGVSDVEMVITSGKPKKAISQRLCKEWKIDLLIIGQSGETTLERLLYGNLSNYLKKHTPCQVRIMTPGDIQQSIASNVILFPISKHKN